MPQRVTAQDKAALRAEAVGLRAQGRSRREIGQALGLTSDSSVGRLLVGTEPRPELRRPRAKDAERDRARALRAKGWTYQQIAAELGVSMSSCSLWLRDLPPPVLERRLEGERWHASRRSVLRRRELHRQQTKLAAAQEVLPLTRRDLLLAGAVAYWCEGGKDKPYKRREIVQFINSDPMLIRLFLRFLDVVGVSKDRLKYRVSIHATADEREAVAYWAGIVGEPPGRFSSSTIKRHQPVTKRLNTGEYYHGCLTIRVGQGADLYRRIEGWAKALALGDLPPP